MQESLPDTFEFDTFVRKTETRISKKRIVLGRQIFDRLYEDRQKTITPSWMPLVPHAWGSTQHGKISTDHWRTICTLHLPITLIRTWGILPAESREFQLLDNFLCLVTATSFASRRSTTLAKRAHVMNYTRKYLKTLVELFPQVSIKPNNHLALHGPGGLFDFGPPHTNWQYPLERLIGLLQQIPINNHFGMWFCYAWFCSALRKHL